MVEAGIAGGSGGRSGPLVGVRVIEIVGLGPGPFAAMMLADMGAEVLRIYRADRARSGRSAMPSPDLMARGRPSVAVDLKHPDGVETVLSLVDGADALIEGFRPGVMERLGIGPEVCQRRNAKLVYGRVTGWGQDGPLASAAGHDLNYIALAGVVHHIGRVGGPPVPPLNLVGDFGGGGMLLAFGVVCGLLEARHSGRGQVVDAAMVDGAALLMTCLHGLAQAGWWRGERGTNSFDSGAHFYEVYETADAKFVSIASAEPQFYAELLRLTGLDAEKLPEQMDHRQWPALKDRLASVFRTRTRDQWCAILEGTDACFAPVLSMSEAPEHLHNRHRQTFVEDGGAIQPAPAPRFSRTPGAISCPPSRPGEDTAAALAAWGFSSDRIASLLDVGAIASG